MGRSNRQTADYFPHYVGESRTKFILETRWGNDGYAFWFKLLELLCTADGQYYDCWPVVNWEYLLALTRVEPETAEDIISTLAGMGKIDEELWTTCRVIWVGSLMDSLQKLYAKRTAAPDRPSVDMFPGRRAPGAVPEEPESPPPEKHAEEQKPQGRRRRPSELSAEQLALFERFYAVYPKKVDRATAERAWRKIKPEPDEDFTERIVRAVEAAKRYDRRFRDGFTPNPASWLNAKGYLNEYTEEEPHVGEGIGYSGFRPSAGFKGS